MSLLRQKIPVPWNGLGVITIQLTGYESTILKLWFGTDIAYKESVDKEVDRSSIDKAEFRTKGGEKIWP